MLNQNKSNVTKYESNVSKHVSNKIKKDRFDCMESIKFRIN